MGTSLFQGKRFEHKVTVAGRFSVKNLVWVDRSKKAWLKACTNAMACKLGLMNWIWWLAEVSGSLVGPRSLYRQKI